MKWPTTAGNLRKVGKLEPSTVNITVTCDSTILFLAISVETLILSQYFGIKTKYSGVADSEAGELE